MGFVPIFIGSVAIAGLIFAPIGHWRTLPNVAFPLASLSRGAWKIVWLLSIATGTVPVVGAAYWWLQVRRWARSSRAVEA